MSAKEVALAYFELSNQRDLSSIKELFDLDATYSSDNTGVYYGRDAVMEMVHTFFQRFPKLNWQITDIDELSSTIVKINFLCSFEDTQGTAGMRSGVETIVVNKSGKLRHVEVRA